VLGEPLGAADAAAPRASGTLASHYAPRTPARLVPAAGLVSALEAMPAPVAVLAHTVARPVRFSGAWITAPVDPARYAHDLYANLRALDATHAATIAVEAVPDDAAWQAVRDRIERATRGDADDRD